MRTLGPRSKAFVSRPLEGRRSDTGRRKNETGRLERDSAAREREELVRALAAWHPSSIKQEPDGKWVITAIGQRFLQSTQRLPGSGQAGAVMERLKTRAIPAWSVPPSADLRPLDPQASRSRATTGARPVTAGHESRARHLRMRFRLWLLAWGLRLHIYPTRDASASIIADPVLPVTPLSEAPASGRGSGGRHNRCVCPAEFAE